MVLAIDGDLTGIPWAALPGDKPGTVLLEQYALTTVPHAPFLLDRLTAPAPPTDDRGVLLAVGGVAYDQAPKPVEDENVKIELLAARQPETTRGRGDGWSKLPGTLNELNAVTKIAGSRTVIRLEGAGAGTAQLVRDLPRARWAHIATHGFFADPSISSVLRPDPKLFSFIGRERVARACATRWFSQAWSWPAPIGPVPRSTPRPTTTWESSPPRRSPAFRCKTSSSSSSPPAKPAWD